LDLIDTHLHCSEHPDDLLLNFAKFNGLEYTLAELLDLMEKFGIECGLLLSPPLKHGSIVPNEQIIELCKKSHDKLFPIVTAEPSEKEMATAVKLAKRNEGFVKGFKVRLGYLEVFPDDPIFAPMFDYAESQNLPVLFHTGDTATSSGSLKHSHPLNIDALANKREALKIVICHFGNPWISDVGELIYKHPNVFADFSGLVAGEGAKYSEKYIESLSSKISEAIYFAGGAEKVFFGTDYPVETFASGLKLMRKLQIDEEDKQKIARTNAMRVFFSES